MDAPPCPECDNPATIEQPDGPRCVAHATDVLALQARLHELGFLPLPAERDWALADFPECALGEIRRCTEARAL